MSTSRHLTLDEVAERYAVHRETIRRRIADGTLPAYQMVGSTKVIRIRAEDAEALFPRVPTAADGAS